MKRETENLILLLVGVSMLMVTVTGAYTRYVKPEMLPWLGISAAILILLAVLAMVRDIRWRKTAEHSPDEHSHGGVAWMLVLPIALLVFIVPPALNAQSVSPTAVQVSEVRPFEDLPAGAAPTVPLPEVLMRIAAGSAGALGDRHITVHGFTMRDGTNVDLAKIVIVCCAADAQLARLRLTGPAAAQAAAYPENTWLSIQGTVPTGQTYSGAEWIPAFNVTSVERIDPPANTYGA